MSSTLSRRRFLTHSLAASAAAPAVMSLEERHLLARSAQPVDSDTPIRFSARWVGQIGTVKISRLICGGNLISGYAHSRDLIYVSDLLRHYFTDDRVMDTWALCEQHGINTMIAFPGTRTASTCTGDTGRAAGGSSTWPRSNPIPRI